MLKISSSSRCKVRLILLDQLNHIDANSTKNSRLDPSCIPMPPPLLTPVLRRLPRYSDMCILPNRGSSCSLEIIVASHKYHTRSSTAILSSLVTTSSSPPLRLRPSSLSAMDRINCIASSVPLETDASDASDGTWRNVTLRCFCAFHRCAKLEK
ncbi:hypothetical protein BDP81DRAFT_199552 [Colletotrichum phormii]|uniref:Uncharacterized protein n=1 Tax=Colletotrichum phormii TaxID=359342 RepID=A0AAI9ZYG8_9PEZI|nr:uncharacterized protein BDP81DRAFT_199552 [Colletotrichum phormii]KAK1639258.1 hypothetical protein BDP81DRAFT_199552 [Colletotrichum phormii]